MIFLTSCLEKTERYEGWTSYNEESGLLEGFQPHGTIDINDIILKQSALKDLEILAAGLRGRKQYYIIAEGNLVADNDFRLPDGIFTVSRILHIGDRPVK